MLSHHLQAAVAPARPLSLAIRPRSITHSSPCLPKPALVAHRSFWSKRKALEYCSHVDPVFLRHIRFRSLKTRAKMLDKIRRRGRWNWDLSQRPFFSSRQIRLASHLNGRPWADQDKATERSASDEDQHASTDQDGCELSQREKVWKSQMDALRKRIEQDPYEAVFGKRFEPFWSPLVPSWMREEMGLQGWPRSQGKFNHPPKSSPVEDQKHRTQPTTSTTDALRSNTHSAPKTSNDSPEASSDRKPGTDSFAYTSTTSWDSWSSKTRREEWDSATGNTRVYEYDPISNRMVQIDGSGPKCMGVVERSPKSLNIGASTAEAPTRPLTLTETSKSFAADGIGSSSAVLNSNVSENAKGVPDVASSSEIVENSASSNASPKSVPKVLPDSSSKTTLPPLNTLTAATIRAHMGNRMRSTGATSSSASQSHQSPTQKSVPMQTQRSSQKQDEARDDLEIEIDALTRRKNKLLNVSGVRRLNEREQKSLLRIEEEVNYLVKQIQDLNKERAPGSLPPLNENAISSSSATRSAGSLPTPLQLSSERLQRRDLPQQIDADDSAAHESTGDNAAVLVQDHNVPKNWNHQYDLLQSSRIERIHGTAPKAAASGNSQQHQPQATDGSAKPNPRSEPLLRLQVPRWIDEMNARKAAYETALASQRANEAVLDASKNAKLLKAQVTLESEANDQKSRLREFESRHAHRMGTLDQEVMTAHEQNAFMSEIHGERNQNGINGSGANQQTPNSSSPESPSRGGNERYKDKIRELRANLDQAFKQSSAQADMHVERINALETELSRSRGLIQQTSSPLSENERQRLLGKIRSLRQELDRTFKQSSVLSDAHVERIQALEKELHEKRSAENNTKENKPLEAIRAEGDFCANVTKYAKDSDKWYKRPALRSSATLNDPLHEQKLNEPEVGSQLAQELQTIYERRYGTINCDHTQPVEKQSLIPDVASEQLSGSDPECDVVLDKALQGFDKVNVHSFKPGTLEAEIAEQEKQAHEAQLTESDASNALSEYAIRPKVNEATRVEPRDIDENSKAVDANRVRWEEPPTYKLLYLDGSRKLEVSTTTAMKASKSIEVDIPLTEALATLDDPAPFIPHLAELQQAGFQVIHSAQDLLVFRKRASNSIAPAKKGQTSPSASSYSSVMSAATGSARYLAEEQAQAPNTDSKSSHKETNADAYAAEDVDYVGKPKQSTRVHREEHVFSGARLGSQPSHKPKRRYNEHLNNRYAWRQRRRNFRGRVRWALGVGLGTAAVIYTVGAIAERRNQSEQGRWQQILDGKKARWE